MKQFLHGLRKKVSAFVRARRALSVVIALALIGVGYFVYGKLTVEIAGTQYVLATAERGTLVVTVGGSGQISASDQIDVKPKVSGDITSLGVAQGDTVQAGQLIAQLDTRDARKAVNDAHIALASEELTLEKMKGLSTAEGTIRGSKEKASDDLAKAYEDGFNTVANAFLDLPTVMNGLNDILFGTTLSGINQANLDYYQDKTVPYSADALRFRDDAYAKYQTARTAYDKNLNGYKATTRFSSTDAIESLIGETYETTKLIAEAVKSASNVIQLYKDQLTAHSQRPAALADTHLASIASYTGKTNSYLLSLLSTETTIQNNKEAIMNVGFDISDQEIKVQKAQYALDDAKLNLASCSIRAPFSGIVAELNVKRGDSVSKGTAIATLITPTQTAEISLNEVDIAKVTLGQKATLTFDAFPDLAMTGEVVQIDALGSVSQGVVSYSARIALDTQDQNVKPGMSVSVSIITDVRPDVITVPISAVKTQNGVPYVEMLSLAAGTSSTQSSTVPIRRTVQVGVSNDTMTEIASGLAEGESVITRTTTNSAQTTTQQSVTSGFRFPGIGGGR